jgi:hypothetical protein
MENEGGRLDNRTAGSITRAGRTSSRLAGAIRAASKARVAGTCRSPGKVNQKR